MKFFQNLRKAITDGAAVELSLQEFNAKNLKSKILEVVENPTYMENMRKRSKIFNDQPMKPLDRAVWWVEYVLRNPEPNHLISPALEMGFFAAYSLDIVVTLFVCITVVLFLIMWKTLKSKCKNCEKLKTN